MVPPAVSQRDSPVQAATTLPAAAEAPFLRHMGLVTTLRCQVACRHCAVSAGPHRTESLAEGEALEWIRQAASYRGGYVRTLSLTGGEPFTTVDTLRRVTAHAADLGMLVTVVTNAYWATDVETSSRLLRSIRGLRMIGLSADVSHQEVIPIQRVRNAVAAAKDCELPFTILATIDSKGSPAHTALLEQLADLAPPEDIRVVTTFLTGRARQTMIPAESRWSNTPCPYACQTASTPVVFPDGKVVACVGGLLGLRSAHPLVLGNLRKQSLEEVFDAAERNPVLHAIRIWGPRKLVELIAMSEARSHLPERYLSDSECDLCLILFTEPHLLAFAERLMSDRPFQRMTAFGRIHYLGEENMLRAMPELASR